MMETRFGFIVSDKLLTLLQEATARLAQGENKKDPMYPYRNRLIEQVNQELIENLMIKQADCISDPKRREGLIKLGHKVQSVTGKIVSVMLSKDKDAVVMASKAFLDVSVARDADGNLRMGMVLPSAYYQDATSAFDAINRGEFTPEIVDSAKKNLKKFDDYLLDHYIIDFVKTLGWGMIKLNLARGAKATISAANHLMIDQMVPKMSLEELQEVAPHIQGFFFESDKIGSDYI